MGWKKEENWYYYNGNQIIKGWLKDNNKWYYLHQDTGKMMSGWIDLKGKIYCANSDGSLITNGFYRLCGKLYYFNKDGLLLEKDRKLKAKVTASVLNVRDSMSTDGAIIGTLNQNQIVEIGLDYTTNLDWYSIYFGSHGGFVSSKYIEILENQEEVLETTGDSLISNQLVEFVKSYEGFSSTPYRGADSQNLTLGYGTTNHCSARWLFNYVPVSRELATKALKEEINLMAQRIKSNLDSKGISLTQNQFDSLCSFAYNCGDGALLSSSLYRRVCAGVRDSSLKENFVAWSNCNGQRLQGLYNRRIEEFNMFINSDYRRDL